MKTLVLLFCLGSYNFVYSQWTDSGSFLKTSDFVWITNPKGMYISHDNINPTTNEISTDASGRLRFVRNTDQNTNTSLRIDDDSNNFYLHPGPSGSTTFLRFQGSQTTHHNSTAGHIWALGGVNYGSLGVDATSSLYLTSGGDVRITGHWGNENNDIFINNIGVGIGKYASDYDFEIDGDVGITGAIYGLSDRNAKSNINSMSNVLSSILALNPVTYYMKEDEEKRSRRFGLVAQEVEKIFPDLIGNFGKSDNDEDYKSIKYFELIPILIQGIKDQNERIVELEAKLVAILSKN